MRRIHIIGRKNSGKTTLVVELVEHLTSAGYRIGTIKHTHHRHELDTPGKDSHRHREAGATSVGILSQGLVAVFQPISTDGETVDRYAVLAPSFATCDLVLVEGDSQTTATKVEVWRAATTFEPLANEDQTISAVITDDPIDTTLPVWPRASVPAIAESILKLCDVPPPGASR